MKVLIVYDSAYGNTEKVAKAIAEAITPHGDVKIAHVSGANPLELKSYDLLIVGSPTQGGRPTPAIQEYIDRIPESSLKEIKIAAFDTRFAAKIARIFGYAATRIAKNLKERGFTLAVPMEGFVVGGSEGPLREGELERAASWAKGIIERRE